MFFIFWWTGRPKKFDAVAAPTKPVERVAPTAAAPQTAGAHERVAPRKTIWTDKTVATISHFALIAWVVVIVLGLMLLLSWGMIIAKSPAFLPLAHAKDARTQH